MSLLNDITRILIICLYFSTLILSSTSVDLLKKLSLSTKFNIPIWRVLFLTLGLIFIVIIFGSFFLSIETTGYIIIYLMGFYVFSLGVNAIITTIKLRHTAFKLDFIIQSIAFLIFIVLLVIFFVNYENGLLFMYSPLLAILNIIYLILLISSSSYSLITSVLYFTSYYPRHTPNKAFQLVLLTSTITMSLFTLSIIDPEYISFDYSIYNNLLNMFAIGYTTFLIPFVSYQYSRVNRVKKTNHTIIMNRPRFIKLKEYEEIVDILSKDSFEVDKIRKILQDIYKLDVSIEIIKEKTYLVTLKKSKEE